MLTFLMSQMLYLCVIQEQVQVALVVLTQINNLIYNFLNKINMMQFNISFFYYRGDLNCIVFYQQKKF